MGANQAGDILEQGDIRGQPYNQAITVYPEMRYLYDGHFSINV